MKTVSERPKSENKIYPYMAVFGEYDTEEDIDFTDVYLISKLNGGKIYVSALLGGKEGYITQNEKGYIPIPVGYKITFTQ